MASQRPVYYEQELEEDINDANLDMAIGNYGQNIYDTGSFYRHLPKPIMSLRGSRIDQGQYSEAALQAIQQEYAAQSALSQVPEQVQRVRYPIITESALLTIG